MTFLSISISFTLLVSVGVSGQQLTFTACSHYVPINVANYSRDSSSKSPLGYYSSVLPYVDEMKPSPCINLTGIPSAAYIELKVETQMSGARICVGDDRTKRTCASGKLETCYTSPGTNVKFAFYCDSACEQVGVGFWYRFVASEANPSDQWCNGRMSDDFPSSLIPLPTNIPTKGSNIKPGGNSVQFKPFSSFVFLSTLLVIFTVMI